MEQNKIIRHVYRHKQNEKFESPPSHTLLKSKIAFRYVLYLISIEERWAKEKKTNHSLGSIKVKWNKVTEIKSQHQASKTHSSLFHKI